MTLTWLKTKPRDKKSDKPTIWLGSNDQGIIIAEISPGAYEGTSKVVFSGLSFIMSLPVEEIKLFVAKDRSKQEELEETPNALTSKLRVQ